jgi:hypothetical protein
VKKRKDHEKWTHIIVPKSLKERLDRLRRRMEEAYSKGLLQVADRYAERIPTYVVIKKGLDEWEAHLARGRRSSRKNGLKALASTESAPDEGRINTPRPEMASSVPGELCTELRRPIFNMLVLGARQQDCSTG